MSRSRDHGATLLEEAETQVGALAADYLSKGLTDRAMAETRRALARGADAVTMIEHTELIESLPAIELRRAATPGQFISYAGSDIARVSALVAGYGDHVPGVQINRFCASGLEAVNLAAQKVRSGWEDLVVAGGVESADLYLA